MGTIDNINIGISLTALLTTTLIGKVNKPQSFTSPSCFYTEILTSDAANTAYNLPNLPLVGASYYYRNDSVGAINIFPGSSTSTITALTGLQPAGISVAIGQYECMCFIAVSTDGAKNTASGANPYNNPNVTWFVKNEDVRIGTVPPVVPGLNPLIYSAAGRATQNIIAGTFLVNFEVPINNTMLTDITVTATNRFTYSGTTPRIWFVTISVVVNNSNVALNPFIYILRTIPGPIISYYGYRQINSSNPDGGVTLGMSSSFPIFMNNGDYIEVYCGDPGGAFLISGATSDLQSLITITE